MDELRHYNLFGDFSLRQVAFLAVGKDPVTNAADAKADVVLDRLILAFYEACHETRALNARRGPWPPNALRPILLDSLHPDSPPVPFVASYVETVESRFRADPDSVRFAREEVARWFRATGNGFDPAYSFDLNASSQRQAPAADIRMADRERTTLLNIIGALLELVLSPRPGREKQSDVIAELIENYGEKQGVAKSTLEQKFAEANKTLRGDNPR